MVNQSFGTPLKEDPLEQRNNNFTLNNPSHSEPKNQIDEDSSYQSSDSGANYRVEIDSTAIRRKVENEGHEYQSDDG